MDRKRLSVLVLALLLVSCGRQPGQLPTEMLLPTLTPSSTPAPLSPTPTLMPATSTPTPLLDVTLTRQAIDSLRTQVASQDTVTPTRSTPTPPTPTPIFDLPIELNRPQVITLDDTMPAEFLYTAPVDLTVSIIVRSLEPPGKLDPLVQVWDYYDELIAANDDHRSGRQNLYKLDAAIDNFLLEAGDYIIRVSNQINTGQVEVLIEGQLPPTETPESDEIPDDEGISDDTSADAPPQGVTQIIPGQVAVGEVFQFALAAAEGETLTIIVRATSQPLDPLVILYDQEGIIVDENDDHLTNYPGLGERDSVIEEVIIPETGTYIIEISDYLEEAPGTFELTIIRH